MTNKHFKLFIRILKEFNHLTMGLILVSTLLYLRLLPRISRALWENMNAYQISSTCLSIILISFNIYLLLKMLDILPENKKSSLAEKLREMFSTFFEYLLWSLKNLYQFAWYLTDFVANKIFNTAMIYYKVFNYLSKKLLTCNKSYIFWVLISLNILPRLIFVLAFTYDVFICQQLNYTFKCIPWLLLALLENFLVFNFENFFDSYGNDMWEATIEKKTNNPDISEYALNPECGLPEFIRDFQDFFDNHLTVLTELKQLILDYKNWKYTVFPFIYINLILCSIRLLGLGYILIHGVL